ncbi:MAG: hypothetical protein LQ341_003110 [Variospora aurantia]|nr:MAG: hypothetical protein LQ341_003110 [Variospora aurantia]
MAVSDLKARVETTARSYHARTPGLSKLPFRAIAIIIGVASVNALLWVAVGILIVSLALHVHIWERHIVIITSIVVAATAAAVTSKFGSFSRAGGIIGTSVSAGVLILLAVANSYILWKLVQQIRSYLTKPPEEDLQHAIQGHGCMFGLLRKMFKLMDRSWKMYPLGVLFGAGFDTSSGMFSYKLSFPPFPDMAAA